MGVGRTFWLGFETGSDTGPPSVLAARDSSVWRASNLRISARLRLDTGLAGLSAERPSAGHRTAPDLRAPPAGIALGGLTLHRSAALRRVNTAGDRGEHTVR